MRILNENEFINNSFALKSGLCEARTVFLNAWLYETSEGLQNTPEKNEARRALEAQIERFEDFIRTENCELEHEYMLL